MNERTNINVIERVIRIVVGAVVMAFAIMGTVSPWFYLGALPLATGASGWCPAYSLLGVSTFRSQKI